MRSALERRVVVEGGGIRLLDELSALVRRCAPPDLEGRICVAVRTDDGVVYWTATLTGHVDCRYTNGVPHGTDAVLLLGEREATIAGDRDLLLSVFAHYTKGNSVLEVRSSQTAKRRRR